jgi:hypothetical protein
MNRILPSQKIGKKTEKLLKQGLDGEADVASLIVRLGIERVIQEMVEEVHDLPFPLESQAMILP